MKIAGKVFLLGILVLGITVVAFEIDQARYVYATPKTQSTFFKTYTPAPVIDRFKLDYSSSWGTSGPSISGRKFATHRTELKENFVVAAENLPALAAAVKDDISKRLAEQNARILRQTRSASEFEVSYEIGNTRGLVVVDPVQAIDPITVAGRAGIRPNEAAVMLRVRIAETWSKVEKASRMDWPSFRND